MFKRAERKWQAGGGETKDVEILLSCKTWTNIQSYGNLSEILTDVAYGDMLSAIRHVRVVFSFSDLTVQLISESKSHWCLFGFVHTRRKREREREVCSLSQLQKFPLISRTPRPHILPPLFLCFRCNSNDSEKHGQQVKGARHRLPFLPVAPPLGRWPLVRSPAVRALARRVCAVPVWRRRGLVEREQTRETLSASGRSDERSACL